MSLKTPITVAFGDGIGPEITNATLYMLEHAGAQLDVEVIEIGRKVYERGVSSGIEPSAWDSLKRTRVFLKAPITTPQGGGFKSLNVTVRKALGLYANVRPCISYAPYVETKHPHMDMVIVRENEEDLYAGIEYRQTQDATHSIKLISRPGCEKIVRYAFEYARQNGRKKVTCMTKDNIMKISDGLFHKVFNEIGGEYPDIAQDHMIIDIGTAMIADQPERFDVIVTTNLYGDIISDVAAQVAGSVGLAGSSNIGPNFAMFEAIHGSAPDIAGQDIANPSGMLLGGIMMLVHIGQGDVAERLHNAWLTTLEEGIHTGDIYQEGLSTKKVGTQEFAAEVVKRLGQKPKLLKPVSYGAAQGAMTIPAYVPGPKATKTLVGVDVFLDWQGKPQDLADRLRALPLPLKGISNRGIVVWPEGQDETFCSDNWRCRFLNTDGACTHHTIVALLNQVHDAGFDFIKTENLYDFDGQRGYSLDQGV